MRKLRWISFENVTGLPPTAHSIWNKHISLGKVARRHRCHRYAAALTVLCCFVLLLPAFLMGQVENGTITGRVTDPSGAVVPGAAMTVTQRATGLLLHGQTNNDGTYSFPQLQPGQYGISVDKQGFKKTETSVTLTVG